MSAIEPIRRVIELEAEVKFYPYFKAEMTDAWPGTRRLVARLESRSGFQGFGPSSLSFSHDIMLPMKQFSPRVSTLKGVC